jgi:hypothetical protein
MDMALVGTELLRVCLDDVLIVLRIEVNIVKWCLLFLDLQ